MHLHPDHLAGLLLYLLRDRLPGGGHRQILNLYIVILSVINRAFLITEHSYLS